MNSKHSIHVLCLSDFFNSILGLSPLTNGIQFIYPEEIHCKGHLVQGIMATPWTKVDTELLNKLPHLKIISCFGVGIDNVDRKKAQERGIIITNTPDIVTADTADITLTLLLALARNVVLNDQFVRSGQWQNFPAPLGVSIFGKTVGILGLGKVGLAIASRSLAFGMKVVYHSRTKKNVPFQYFNHLCDMAKKSDFLIVSCTGDLTTKHIVNLEVLTALGKNSYLINVSRGITVNEDDLIFALQNKLIAGAGLDVYQNEPNIRTEFSLLSNVVLLPHIGTATKETREKMLNLTLNNIQAFFMNGKALTPI